MTVQYVQNGCFRHFLSVPILGCLFLIQSSATVHAVDLDLSDPNGTQAFRRLLHEFQLKPLSHPTDLELQPERKILIILGKGGRPLREGPPYLSSYELAHAGVAVLLASDHSFHAYGVGNKFLRIDDGSGYRGLADFPFVQPVRKYRWSTEFPFVEPVLSNESLIFNDLARISTNRPSYLDGSGNLPSVSILAELPPKCRPDDGSSQTRWNFAAGGSVGRGQLLILADHSIFINSMMQQTDNDNAQFAYNCIDWLRGPDKQRDQVLFIEDGEIQRKFDVPLHTVPPLDAGDFTNQIAHELDKEQRLDRMVQKFPIGGTGQRIGLYLLTLLGFICGLFVLIRLGLRSTTTTAAPGATIPRSRQADGLLRQRHQALVTSKNLWEPACTLAREFFESIEVTATEIRTAEPHRAEMALNSFHSDKCPRVTAVGGFFHRWTLRRQVHRLWKLANGPGLQRISSKEFPKLLVEIDRLKALLAAGQLRIEFA